ncbi:MULTISPECIES: SigE family RNA polymerase sigma factor [unclassified Streptomyces]|uniref:SigE family RNA polymerase sigma factor n=1 Tax=unclassified Streptomyces TaxID=2593676 RepID=UPI001F0460D0|nr:MULTISPECIES: SigE family RNA polymerase sigma factor [unclassified Streptomyces]MCH0563623.1 SigE family RNA polymerase sigma factor [Streptomyces sp. MUM 2J]MCH0570756.1 SigE family RNA polymerase sigma factor [Streptomyces sp. MUM 136J]
MRQVRAQEYAEFAAARTGQLYRSACLLTAGDTHLAEDLVQETLGRVYLRWGRVSRVGNPAAYAQTVLTRTFLAHKRLRRNTERATDVVPDTADDLPDASLRLTLLQALGQLPAKDRAVVVLRYWEDRSVQETADVLHASSAAVRTRSVRALARLRELLGEDVGVYARP